MSAAGLCEAVHRRLLSVNIDDYGFTMETVPRHIPCIREPPSASRQARSQMPTTWSSVLAVVVHPNGMVRGFEKTSFPSYVAKSHVLA